MAECGAGLGHPLYHSRLDAAEQGTSLRRLQSKLSGKHLNFDPLSLHARIREAR